MSDRFKSVNLDAMRWEERRSNSGRFHLFQKRVSVALGAPKNASVQAGGHPFDVTLVRVAPGAYNWPLHQHTAQWELFVVLVGQAEVTVGEQTHTVAAGDCFMQPPGTAHQLKNTGDEELVYYIVADNPPADISYYPRSGKYYISPQAKVFYMKDADYYDGEDG